MTCYFMAAHPGETEKEAEVTRAFIKKNLKFSPEQVQIFTPTPSTWATCAYHTEIDEEGFPVFSEKRLRFKERLKEIIMISRQKHGKK